MDATGIICEYNPLHKGHKKQLDAVRAMYPEDGIVCLMSGNFVQRGAPAVFDKSVRAEAAVKCGADLVLELPLTASLSSAEGFASEGVRILGGFCKRLCFGAETADKKALLATARALLRPEFSDHLRTELDKGLSFPAARQAALAAMGGCAGALSLPNDILGVEYCKAILQQGLSIEPVVIRREGGYHDTVPDAENPSATALRAFMDKGEWLDFVPEEARDRFAGAAVHSLQNGEQAMLYRLQAMTDGEFEALPYGSEGLWCKLMKNARQCGTLEAVLTATKTKRYTRTRLDRMVMCAFLGLTREDLLSPAPYVRVLALNDRGRELLKAARQNGTFLNAGEPTKHPYKDIEQRAGRLYSLFAAPGTPPVQEAQRRVVYVK